MLRLRTPLALTVATSALATAGLASAPALAAVDNHITHVSAATPEAGPNGSYPGGVSDDGRYVVFASHQPNLVPSEPGDLGRYVYLRDTTTGTITRLSHGPDGYLMSSSMGISGNGRYVVYASRESSFGGSALRLYDHTTGKTKVISPPVVAGIADSEWFNPAISDNGKIVVYTRTSLTAAGDVSTTTLYRYDRVSKQTTLVEPGPLAQGGGTNPPYLGGAPVLSADGRFVAYNRPAAGQPGVQELVRRDLSTGAVLTIADAPVIPGPNLGTPSISNSGRFVAFQDPDASGATDAYLYDANKGTSQLVGYSPQGDSPAGYVVQPSVSGDGRYVAFSATGGDIVPGAGTAPTIVIWDRTTRSFEAPVKNLQGAYPASSGATSSTPYLDADGSILAFTSRASNLVAGVPNTRFERVYTWQR